MLIRAKVVTGIKAASFAMLCCILMQNLKPDIDSPEMEWDGRGMNVSNLI